MLLPFTETLNTLIWSYHFKICYYSMIVGIKTQINHKTFKIKKLAEKQDFIYPQN